MADTKISALAAVVAPAGTDEFGVNQAGTSKKETLAQIDTYVNTAPVWAAGTASAGTWPKLTSGTVLTTPEAGALEYDGKVVYVDPEASNRGVVPAEYFICLSGANTLTSQTANQPIFDSVGGGTLTLPVGTYFFDCLLSISGMSATSGNFAFNILGGGNAVLGSILYYAVGVDGPVATAAAQTGSTSILSASVASIVSAATNTTAQVYITGTFRVTTAGTIIPGIALVTASAAVVAVGSYFKCHCVGSQTVQTVGRWS